MNSRLKKSAASVRKAIRKSLIPRNQIASISGLTNTYIRDLEQGNIVNVSREKLLQFAAAVGLNLKEIDDLLMVFDRTRLNPDDIPIFIKNAKKQKPSGIVHTARDFFGYELLLLMAESLPGPKILCTNHPTAILEPEGLRSYFSKNKPQRHPIHDELNEAVGRERKRNLISQLGRYDMHHYISRRALEDYVLTCRDPEERRWKVRHLMEIIEFVHQYEKFRYCLTDVDNGFNFLLKFSSAGHAAEWVFFYSHDLFLMQGQMSDQLIGFYTGNKVLVEQFKKDTDIVKAHVLDEYRDPASLERFILELAKKAAG